MTGTSSLQPTGVAGLFYPAAPDELAAGVDASLAKASPTGSAPKAMIAPHAGHIYSGDIAGTGYRLLAQRKGEIKRVVLLGPNHRMPVRGVALSPANAWQTPFGPLAVDRVARDSLAGLTDVNVTPAPFVGEHSLEVHLPFIHRALGEIEILPILVGQATSSLVSDILEASWGGPETAVIVSSDLSHFHDYETCRSKDKETAAGIERLDSRVCQGDRACGSYAIAGLLEQARRRDLRVTTLDLRNSGDTQGARDRVVGYASFAFEYAHTAKLPASDRRILFEVARDVLKQASFHSGKPPQLNIESQLSPSLMAQRATFVTLKIGGQLRGCVGSVLPHQPLILDVANNALKSGFGDSRFLPLSAGELDRLEFHVSILSTPRRIMCKKEIDLVNALRPDAEGLIIRDGAKQALFLPSVWEQIYDPLTFLRQLKLKAGLPPDYWSDSFEAYRFVTESFGEHTENA